MRGASISLALLAFFLTACNLPSRLLSPQSPAITSGSAPETEAGLLETQPAHNGAANSGSVVPQPTPFLETASSETLSTLPAALLFLSHQSGSDQIWQLEADGLSLRQITHEAAPVTDFDISPLDGRLAYAAGNDLIIAEADGSGRILLVDGPPLPSENDPDFLNQLLGKPRWSPDGKSLAYSLGGVNVIGVSESVPFQLISNDDPSQSEDQTTQKARFFFWAESWAPDGKRLLLGYAGSPALGGLAVINAAGGEPLFIQNPPLNEAMRETPPGAAPIEVACCNPLWSLDGSAIYYANPFPGMFSAGLWRANAATGQSQTLIPGQTDDGLYHLPGFVFQAKNGMLYYFYGQADAFPEGDVMLTPVQAKADALTQRAPLRNDAWLVGEALWSPDAQGVVILDLASAAPGEFPRLGKLFYLPLNGGEAFPLPVSGYALHWGTE